MARLSHPLLILATASLTGCAAQGDFPSLAPRAIERGLAGGSAPAPCAVDESAPASAAGPAAPPPNDRQLRARIAELAEAARAGQTEFQAVLPSAETAVARAGAAGSELWVAAQLELSRLEAARARTADALAELDALGLRRSAGGAISAGDQQAIAQAEAEARALAERQQAELQRLSGRLSAP